MNKKVVFCFFLFFVFCKNVLAETYYYKLTKKIENEKEFVNTAGGQFITFIGEVCFDSDKYGVSVGNGKLKFSPSLSSSTPAYVGNSYFGNVVYRFNNDKSILNIHVNNSLIYVYKRAEAPNGVVTSSLIKKKNTTQPIPLITPTYQGSPSMNTMPSNNTPTQQNNSPSYKPSKHKCNFCDGKGKITRNDNPPPSFGYSKARKKCSECGYEYDPTNVNHYHVRCSNCKGKGYW